MREMIKARKEELQKRGVSGFTLMEMLIVVAIIAILIAIAIPVFNAQLDKARLETASANARSTVAVATASYMTDNSVTTSFSAAMQSVVGANDYSQGCTISLANGTITVSNGAGSQTINYDPSVITGA